LLWFGASPLVIAQERDTTPRFLESRRLCYAPHWCSALHVGAGLVTAVIGTCALPVESRKRPVDQSAAPCRASRRCPSSV